MSEHSERLTEQEECEALLPFYVTGRLAPAERARVEACLARHPDMRAQLAMVAEDRDATTALNEAMRPPRSLSADALVGKLPALDRAGGARGVLSSAIEAARDFFAAPTAMGVRWAGAAALALFLVQAAVIGALLTDKGDGPYVTASGSDQARSGAIVLVRFVPAAGIQAITAALETRGMRIVDGPKPGQLYVVRIGEETMSADRRDKAIAELKTMTSLVEVVLPSGP